MSGFSSFSSSLNNFLIKKFLGETCSGSMNNIYRAFLDKGKHEDRGGCHLCQTCRSHNRHFGFVCISIRKLWKHRQEMSNSGYLEVRTAD